MASLAGRPVVVDRQRQMRHRELHRTRGSGLQPRASTTVGSAGPGSCLADRLLHDVVPALYVIYWTLFAEKGVVRWRDIPGWLAYPMLYLAVTLVHGAFIGWYPYPFINVTKLGYGRTFVNVLILITTFAVIGAVIRSLIH